MLKRSLYSQGVLRSCTRCIRRRFVAFNKLESRILTPFIQCLSYDSVCIFSAQCFLQTGVLLELTWLAPNKRVEAALLNWN